MKIYLKKILFTLCIVSSILTYSQVTVVVEPLKVNNVTISNSGPINFNQNSTINVNFGVTLSKSSNYIVGDGYVYVKSRSSSSGTVKIYSTTFVPQANFSTLATTSNNFNFIATDFDFSGGYMYVEFQQANSPGALWSSINIPVIKSPTYNLTTNPTSSSIPCGSTTPITFTISSNSIGNLYQWNVGNGWIYNGGYTPTQILNSTGTLVLTPSSFPLGSVTVTPLFNNVTQPMQNFPIILSPFISTAAISGANSICTPAASGVYSISNQGTNTVTWSSSNTAIATVSATTGTSITVNKVSNGTFNLVARITNTCNQYLDVTKSIRIGSSPSFNVTKVANTGGYDLAIVNVPSTENQGITSATWVKTSGNGTITGYGLTAEAHGSPTSAWTVTANITATNDCGSTTISKTYSSAGDGTHKMNVVPTKHNIYVLDDITNSETKSSTNDIQIKSAVLFDLNGLKILEFKSNYFDISTVKKGVYILKVQTNDELITSKIVVK